MCVYCSLRVQKECKQITRLAGRDDDDDDEDKSGPLAVLYGTERGRAGQAGQGNQNSTRLSGID